MIELELQFERLIRLIGYESFLKLRASHVMVVGIGGVGSWACESLVRSGIGRLTLVDFDLVGPSNLNRQLTAAQETIGQVKCRVMAQRILDICPQCRVSALQEVYCPETSEAILADSPDVIIDAIDNITYKCHLLATCHQKNIRIISSTGAAGRLDPTRVKVTDLSHTKVDPVALQVRKKLRRDWGFPGNKSFHIPAVYSDEEPIPPQPTPDLLQELGDRVNGKDYPTDFDPQDEHPTRKAPPYGTAAFVTAAFGLTAASCTVKTLLDLPLT